jgi:hypothetical protein
MSLVLGGMSVQDHFPSFYRQVKLLTRIIATAIKGEPSGSKATGLYPSHLFKLVQPNVWNGLNGLAVLNSVSPAGSLSIATLSE